MLELTLASWRQHRNRYVATFLAILLGVGFGAATLALTAAAKQGAADAGAVQYGKADVVLFTDASTAGAVADRVARVPGVTAAAVIDSAEVDVSWPEGHVPGSESMSEISSDAALRWQRLTSGVFPAAPDQVVVDADLAASENVGLGSRLILGGADTPPRTVTVVGLLHPEKGAQGVSPIGGYDGVVAQWGLPAVVTEVDVRGEPGVSQPALAQYVRAVVPNAEVVTADALRTAAVSELSNKVDVLGTFSQGFALVALFVAGLVIANTFRIVMTQRLRDLALLRCVGALRWQIFAMSVGEALLLGVFAAAVGTVAGVACAGLIVEVLDQTPVSVPLSFSTPSLATLLLPFAGGVVMAMAAVLAPASRAAQVSPLAALRPEATVSTRSRSGALQLAAGVLLGFLGLAFLALAVTQGVVLAGLAGGLVSFAGVLALTPFIVPFAIRSAGHARRLVPRRLRGGVPAELSVLNAIRNPRRTAATAAALLVGVTLISMMSVGAASVSATEASGLDRVAPVDETVSGGAIPAGLLSRARQVDGVRQVVAAQGLTVDLGGRAVEVAALTGPQSAVVVRDAGLRSSLADPATLMVPVSAQGVLPGHVPARVTLRLGAASVRVAPLLSSLLSGPVLVSPATLARLGGRPHVVALYLRVTDGADPQTVSTGLRDAIGSAAPRRGLLVTAGYTERSTYDRTISVLLLVSTALLGMAVLIALVGVGNTLSLSVLERTRENGLLRALGLTTRQLRLLLADEAILVAGTAAVLGTVLGVGYGWAGTLTLLHGTTSHAPTLALPVSRLALVAVVAVGAGLLASVLPARRAARMAPVEALNQD